MRWYWQAMIVVVGAENFWWASKWTLFGENVKSGALRICQDYKKVKLKMNVAFTPVCQDEKAHLDTPSQKPL